MTSRERLLNEMLAAILSFVNEEIVFRGGLFQFALIPGEKKGIKGNT